MLTRIAVAAAAVLLALGPSAAESREQEELALSLTCKPPSFKVRRPLLVLNGTCPLPDGVVLKVNLNRVAEAASGLEIQPFYVGAGNGTAEIEGKKFIYDSTIDGPGKFNVQVSLVEDLQEKHLAAEVKKRAGGKRNFQFEFLVWGDDLIPQIAPKLNELTALVNETRELVKKFETASASEVGWAQQQKPLTAEGTKFQAKLEHHELKSYYPAAVNTLYYTIRNVVNNAPYYTFGGGKFTGARDYHAAGEKVKTFRNEDFNWENLKRYVDEAQSIGGREFCLWILKDLRRTAGQMRNEITEAIKSQKTAAGVDGWQERLLKATITDIDPLEAEIRGSNNKKDTAPKDGEKK
jgi:hypothetical protein